MAEPALAPQPAPRRRSRVEPQPAAYLPWPSCFDFDDDVRQRFIDQLTAAAQAGPIHVVHPTAGGKAGRAELSKQLRLSGVKPETIAVLGWATSDPTAQVKPKVVVTAPPEPAPARASRIPSPESLA